MQEEPIIDSCLPSWQKCVYHLFEEQARQIPNKVAVVKDDHYVTYAELDARATQLARYLREIGVRSEVRVALCVERSLEMLIGLLGIFKAGGVYVPIDPDYPIERRAFMLGDSAISVVVTQSHLCATLMALSSAVSLEVSAPADSRVSSPFILCLDTDWTQIASTTNTRLPYEMAADYGAYVIYTSGSTGQPKGVMVPHGALVNHSLALITRWDLRATDRVLQFASLSFDVMLEELFPSFMCGATVVLQPLRSILAFPDFLQFADQEYLSVLNLPAPYWHAWVLTLGPASVSLPCALRLVVVGSEAVLHERFVRWHSSIGQRVRWFNAYGPTETTITALLYEPEHAQIVTSGHALPIGQPIANVQAYVLDQGMNVITDGAPGELYIGGMGVARGYLNRPDLTAERFVPNPFACADVLPVNSRLYRTGDRVCALPDGNIAFLGRVDQQVKVRGFRIELGEIEAVLRRHEAVDEVVVNVHERMPDEKHLVAYIVLRHVGDEMNVSTGVLRQRSPSSILTDLRRFLHGKLPGYMVPTTFLLLDALPRLPNGKVARRALPVPDRIGGDRAAFCAPRTAVEKMLAEVWADIFGLAQMSVYDNFFEIGGHSLAAIQVVSRIRDLFQIEVSLAHLFQAPTLEDMAHLVEQRQHTEEQRQFAPIRRASPDVVRPLSFSQEGVWFLTQLMPESIAYHAYVTIRFEGQLDLVALERVLSEVVRRHEILRTTFEDRQGRPVQVVHAPRAAMIPVIDMGAVPAAMQEAAVERMIFVECRRPFILSRIPLVRWTLLRLRADVHVLVQVEHHFLHDGWSLARLLQEIRVLYAAFSVGAPSPLSELPIQYGDYAVWQREWVTGEVAQRQLLYWKKKLAGSPPVLTLPMARTRPAIQSFKGAMVRAELPEALCAALRVLSRQEGVTLFMTMLAVFKMLIARYTGQDDIVIGSSVANRRLREVEQLFGMVINNVVFRTQVSGNPTFRALLARVRDVTLEAYEHQDMPFDKVVEALRPERDLSYNPVIQVMFSFHDAAIPSMDFPDVQGTIRYPHNGSAKFDMNVILMPLTEQRIGQNLRVGDERIVVEWEYSSDLFDEPTIWRMIDHYQMLLAGVVAHPDQPIAMIPLLPNVERDELLLLRNRTDANYPRHLCLHQLFEEQVVRTPEATAVVFADQHVSYQELNLRANQLGHALRSLGVGTAAPVGICMERSLEMVVGLLGILKAGSAFVPLDASFPTERLTYILEDAQVPLLLTQRHVCAHMPDVVPQLCIEDLWPTLVGLERTTPKSHVTSDHLAYLIYTSGSTGRPKGVLIPHCGIVNYLAWCVPAYTAHAGRGAPVHASIAADAIFPSLFAPLCVGTSVMVFPESRGLDAFGRALVADGRFSFVKITPSQLEVLSHQLPQSNATGWVHTLVVGAEAVRAHVLTFWQTHAPLTQILNEYGPTETVVGCSVYPVPPGQQFSGTVPIGLPIANMRFYVLDGAMQVVPIGVPGELYIGGEGVAWGYLNRPDLTAESFVPNPFVAERGAQGGATTHPFPHASALRLYRTGDVVRYLLDQMANIEFLGRRDDQVKIRGYRVELGEIEAVLDQHPGVREVVVLAREDAPGNKRLVAYLSPAMPPPSVAELRDYLLQHVPEYMVPAVFVFVDAIPLTPHGKIDRQALPAPATTRPELHAAFAAPRTPTEESLVAIWSDVLGVERIGIQDNFFHLGGHSLLAMQVLARLRQAFMVEMPLRTLFETPTVAGLAEIVVQYQLAQADTAALADLLADVEQLSLQDALNVLTHTPSDEGRNQV